MTYKSYTQNLVLKNPQEPVKSRDIVIRDGKISKYLPLGENPQLSSFLKSKFPLIICPGFINLHSHLAYTDIHIEKQGLFPWIKKLVKELSQNDIDLGLSTYNGALEAISYGTTFVVDNTNHPYKSLEAFSKSKLKGIIALEVFGSDPEQAEAIFDQHILELSKLENSLDQNSNFEFCLSPHASYDVSTELWHKCLEWSQKNNKTLFSHIAESKEEESWFKSKSAPEAESFWQSIGTLEAKEKNWQKYKGSVDFLAQNNLLNYKLKDKRNPLVLTHAVEASKTDLAKLEDNNISLITCPRSNEFLGNSTADIKAWQKLNINFGLGTDSKASNQDLDLRKEINKIPGLSAQDKFELLTSKAAQILGKQDEIGSLEPGMSADFTVFELKADLDLDNNDPLELLFDTEMTEVKAVYINGEEVFQRDEALVK